jgi:hypothetical protein
VSLLDKGRETVILYNEETYTTPDGNPSIRASSTPITINNCVVQLLAQSGTSARRTEDNNEGWSSEQVYRLRPPRSFTTIIGMGAKIVWQGIEWSVFGKVRRYNGSPRTAHMDYIIRRN